ncbi:MAG: hypothetical protein R3C26_13330 [Calditrichia bacterium]
MIPVEKQLILNLKLAGDQNDQNGNVIKLLSENRNERGMVNWEKSRIIRGFTSYGIGLTQLKKLAQTGWQKSRTGNGIVA